MENPEPKNPNQQSLDEQRKAFYEENPDLGGKYQVNSDRERECPVCGNINSCTGFDHCSTCGGSLGGARRTNTHLFDPDFY